MNRLISFPQIWSFPIFLSQIRFQLPIRSFSQTISSLPHRVKMSLFYISLQFYYNWCQTLQTIFNFSCLSSYPSGFSPPAYSPYPSPPCTKRQCCTGCWCGSPPAATENNPSGSARSDTPRSYYQTQEFLLEGYRKISARKRHTPPWMLKQHRKVSYPFYVRREWYFCGRQRSTRPIARMPERSRWRCCRRAMQRHSSVWWHGDRWAWQRNVPHRIWWNLCPEWKEEYVDTDEDVGLREGGAHLFEFLDVLVLGAGHRTILLYYNWCMFA